MIQSQISKNSRFDVQRSEGVDRGTVIFRLSGPFTARDMYGSISPMAFRRIFELAPGGARPEVHIPAVHIVDLSEVPYMDFAGLDMILSHFLACRRNGIRVIVTGVGPRVLERIRNAKMESILPMAVSAPEPIPRPQQGHAA